MSKTKQQAVCAQRVATSGVMKVRMPLQLKYRLELHAKHRGMDLSAWVRRALKLQADREATYLPPPPLDIDPRDAAVMKHGRMDQTEEA